MKKLFVLFFFLLSAGMQSQLLMIPDRVFDGENLFTNWIVVVDANHIDYAGPLDKCPIKNIKDTILLKGMTLLPGIIEGHSHLLLHPYNETSWNDQVLKESPAERAIRGAVYARRSLLAGITTMRDLGAEGAGYTDVYLKKTIDEGMFPDPAYWLPARQLWLPGLMAQKGFMTG